MKIGLFGGTFNPPHKGHKRLCLLSKEALGLSKIIIMPTKIPPHKNVTELISSKERIKLCEMTFFEDFFFVSDLEQKLPGKSYTVNTLRELKRALPNDEIFLIVGSDMLLSFDKWFEFEEILKMVKIVCVTRKDEIKRDTLISFAENTLGLKENEDIFILDNEPFVVSSSGIREKIKNNEDVSSFLEESANRYIMDRGLYR